MAQTVTYNLLWVQEQTVNLPEGSTVITGMIKEGVPTVWVKEDSSANRVPKQFRFFETKDEGYAAGWHYVCTVLVPDEHGGDQSNLFMQK
jgi:hypothetical protein